MWRTSGAAISLCRACAIPEGAAVRITRVQATYLPEIPIEAPPYLTGPLRARAVIVQVDTDDGLTGYGMTGEPQFQSIVEFVNTQARELLIGEDPLLHERIGYRMFRTYNPRCQTGAWSQGLSAIDIALWDIKGKAFGLPVWRLLGGAQSTVPAYVTFGEAAYDLEGLVAAARYWVSKGHTRLKMVVGVKAPRESTVAGLRGGALAQIESVVGQPQDPEVDAARVAAVREAVGPDVQLFIDANYALPQHQALRLCKLIEPLNITWFEEPVYQNDALLLAELRRATSIPIAAGQNEGNRFRHREFLLNRSVDIIQPNVTYVGGYTEGAKVAAMAQAFNIPIANGGGWPFHNMHLQAGMANGSYVELHFRFWQIYRALFQSLPEPVDGWLTVPETPGVGLEPRPGAIQEFSGV
jgi:L-rhamnonate dehydratase